MGNVTLWRRRRLVQGLAGALLLPALGVRAAAPVQLNILTSYPDEVMARFEAAFEKLYPQYRIRFLWRMPHDALPYLERQGGTDTVDVYWAASPRTFARLKERQLLRKLEIDRSGLPASVGTTQISDPDGYYLATELAGYVLALNERKLAALGVAAPGDWHELANPRLLDNIALPVPSEVGFAPVMYDIVLQAYGWQKGWAIWSEVAALSQLIHRGSSFIGDRVGSGDIAIGLSIDFFVKAAISNGAPLSQRYPLHNGVNPGHVALPKAGLNADGAQAFARFVVSPQGQALLNRSDIRKLAVRPQTYEAANAIDFNPFAAAAAGTMNYDGARGRERLNVISAVFDQMLARPHNEQRALWQRVYAAERAGKNVDAVRALLSEAPLDETAADSEAVKRLFRDSLEGGKQQDTAMTQAWADACTARRGAAGMALDRIGA
ncbi:MAG: extracellular solute-binding protein [Pseudomonadota bacterium]